MLQLKKVGTKRSILLVLIISVLSIGLFLSNIDRNTTAYAANNGVSDEAGQHFIAIYDGSKKTIIRSNAATVREALERAGIAFGEHDRIEPELDTEINEESFNINIYRAKEVVVVDGLTRFQVLSASTDKRAIVESAGIELAAEDEVDIVSYDNLLEAGSTVAYSVRRAANIRLDFYGKVVDLKTQAETVQDFLVSQNISTDSDKNWFSLPLDSKIVDGGELRIMPQGEQVIVLEEPIPFNERTEYDYAMPFGQREVINPGQPGKRNATYKVVMRDGNEISRELLAEIVVVEPVEQIVIVGRKVELPAGSHEDWMRAAGIAPSDFGYVNFIVSHESTWNPLAVNRSSGATGLCQALPGSKMASAGSDWATNPITQLRWCNSYAVGRYGSWASAYEFWQSKHWW